MIEENHTLSAAEKSMLERLIGGKIESIEGYLLFDEPESKVFSNHLRINLEGKKSLDITCSYETASLADGEREEAGTLSVGNAEKEIWVPAGERTQKMSVHAKVKSIGIVNDKDILSHKDTPTSEISFSQAIVFDLGESYLVIDKGTFTEDFIKVRRGKNINELTSDCSSGWIEGEDWSNENQRTLIWLEENPLARN